MEDAHDVKIGLKYGLKDWSYFAVFDGHAGKRAAAFAAWNLLEFILRDSQLKLQTKDLPGHVPIEPELEKDTKKNMIVEHRYRPGSSEQKLSTESEPSQCDSQASSEKSMKETTDTKQSDPSDVLTIQTEKNVSSENTVPKPELISLPVKEQLISVKEAIRSGFLRIDESMRVADDLSGCTAICVLISPTHLFIANCGDSRAVLFDGVTPTFATEDHKPLNPKERQRIINAGGFVSQRINGTLAVSRALGDFEFKKDNHRGPCEQLVSPEPEVTVIDRGEKDEFLVLACDGIWDVMENNELCEFIQYRLRVDPSVQNVCSSVIDLCLHRGSRDNMSIIIVVFENGPKFSEEFRSEEEKSDKALAELARSLSEQSNDWVDFIDRLRDTIEVEKNDPKISAIRLPPGGGLEAKYDMLLKIFEEENMKSEASPQEATNH